MLKKFYLFNLISAYLIFILTPVSLAATAAKDMGQAVSPTEMQSVGETVYYVSKSGNDNNLGTSEAPFLTINKAASIAVGGDTVIVYGGTYREKVSPVEGGRADAPVRYMAAKGEEVIIKGSELMEDWQPVSETVYEKTIPESFFKGYNPYRIAYKGSGAQAFTLGGVYIDGFALTEAASNTGIGNSPNYWKVLSANESDIVLRANFGGKNPNTSEVEINVREQIFAPEVYNLGYINIDGFKLYHAANQFAYRFWDVDGEQQKGALSTSGGHNWVIENCTVSYAKSIGIDFGYQGTGAMNKAGISGNGTAYQKIGRVGHHIIRGNTVSYCGSTGMAGAWGPYTSILSNKIMYNNLFNCEAGYEQGGIKVHWFFDGLVEGNLFKGNKYAALWLDNSDDGARVTGNTFVENDLGLFVELTLGPHLIDNNIFIKSPLRVSDSSATSFIYNLFYESAAVNIAVTNPNRTIALYSPVSASMLEPSVPALLADNAFLMNIFIKNGLTIPAPSETRPGNYGDYNISCDGAAMVRDGQNSSAFAAETGFSYTVSDTEVTVDFNLNGLPAATAVDINNLSINRFSSKKLHWLLNYDFFGIARPQSATAGPFSQISDITGLRVWPRDDFSYSRPNKNYDLTDTKDMNKTLSGEWVTEGGRISSGDYFGELIYTKNNGNYIETYFVGEYIEVICPISSEQGQIDVYLDDVFAATVDCHNDTYLPQQKVYSNYSLSNREHKIKLVKKSGDKMYIDGVRFSKTAPLNLDFSIENAGNWTTYNAGTAVWAVQTNGYSIANGRFTDNKMMCTAQNHFKDFEMEFDLLVTGNLAVGQGLYLYPKVRENGVKADIVCQITKDTNGTLFSISGNNVSDEKGISFLTDTGIYLSSGTVAQVKILIRDMQVFLYYENSLKVCGTLKSSYIQMGRIGVHTTPYNTAAIDNLSIQPIAEEDNSLLMDHIVILHAETKAPYALYYADRLKTVEAEFVLSLYDRHDKFTNSDVYVAQYNSKGQMISLNAAKWQNSGTPQQSVTVSATLFLDAAETIKVFAWKGDGIEPLCENNIKIYFP
ncbi:MAG: right-handed parallel beta-helix repeat-containing protein [Firmicutes bacterium]|nr:right-handed parallel beta-helix repeat-containing protein [Bacillota bacterium]